MNKFKIYKDPQAVAIAAADFIYQRITSCVAEKNQCHVILPGGSSPALCLELLAKKKLPWGKIHWYLGDERCLPLGHADRNDSMIIEKLFSQQPSAIKNFHAIPAELGPLKAAASYTKLIAHIHDFDIAILGMGEDGHTASLFPEQIPLDDQQYVVPIFNAPKPPDERVSLGLKLLKSASTKIIITTGTSKFKIIAELQQGKSFPVSQIEPDVFFVDQLAIPE